MRVWARRALTGAATVGAFVACVELGGPSSGVVSISTLRLPYPSVVLGDVMRDSLGAATPISITAFGPDGQPLPAEPVAFLALDSTISIDPDGTVHGLILDTLGGRAIAGAGTLQTAPHRIIVSIAPTTVTKAADATPIAFEFAPEKLDSTTASNHSPALTLTLTGAAGAAAQGYIVVYEITRSPAALDAGKPTAYVADAATTRTARRDTTDSRGVAARRVILRLDNVNDEPLVTGQKTDTIIVRATVKYLGAEVPGSPVDFVVPVSKKP